METPDPQLPHPDEEMEEFDAWVAQCESDHSYLAWLESMSQPEKQKP
jgi:hypothetical protein